MEPVTRPPYGRGGRGDSIRPILLHAGGGECYAMIDGRAYGVTDASPCRTDGTGKRQPTPLPHPKRGERLRPAILPLPVAPLPKLLAACGECTPDTPYSYFGTMNLLLLRRMMPPSSIAIIDRFARHRRLECRHPPFTMKSPFVNSLPI
jgi:hypothetical protein